MSQELRDGVGEVLVAVPPAVPAVPDAPPVRPSSRARVGHVLLGGHHPEVERDGGGGQLEGGARRIQAPGPPGRTWASSRPCSAPAIPRSRYRPRSRWGRRWAPSTGPAPSRRRDRWPPPPRTAGAGKIRSIHSWRSRSMLRCRSSPGRAGSDVTPAKSPTMRPRASTSTYRIPWCPWRRSSYSPLDPGLAHDHPRLVARLGEGIGPQLIARDLADVAQDVGRGRAVPGTGASGRISM